MTRSRPVPPSLPVASTAASVRAHLGARATPERARSNARFFKSGPGQYGEGDRFAGVDVPDQRAVARLHRALPLSEITSLVASPIHEERLTGLLILVDRYRRGDEATQEACVTLYLRLVDEGRVDNWDLVDSSAPQILGAHLLTRPRKERRLLDRLAASPSLWQRRVAMITTQAFLRAGETDDALRLAEVLLADQHDLMHKAVGWMLREAGKYVGPEVLRGFLTRHVADMPRTALRYAIEHLPVEERQRWMAVPPRRRR